MKIRKVLSVILTIAMIVSMMTVSGITASAKPATDQVIKVGETQVIRAEGIYSSEAIDGNYYYVSVVNRSTPSVPKNNISIESVDQDGNEMVITIKGVAVTAEDENLDIVAKVYSEEESDWVDAAIQRSYHVVPADDAEYLDIDTSTTEILDSKDLDQNYNLTVNEGTNTDVSKVKLSWEIKDINVTRTDNKVWDTENLCWKTGTSSTEIKQAGTAKFTLENYSSVKVDAKVTFDTAEYEEGKKFAAPTLIYNEGNNTAGTDDGKITLDTANGNSTYSKTNVPTGEINVTVTPDNTDTAFKTLTATTSAKKYGTYTVSISKAKYSIIIDEFILSICSLDSGCPTKIAPNGSATLTFTANKGEGESYLDLHAYNISVANADVEGDDWDVSEYGKTATLTISNPTGDVTISGSECLAAGTKITMADGTQKKIEDIAVGEKVLSFNHETGKYVAQEVYVAYAGEEKDYGTELTFSDGTTLTIVGEHDLFEKESMEYVTLTRATAKTNIGKQYYNAETGKFVVLTGVNATAAVNYYSIYVKNTFNCIANGMLTLPDDVDYLLNFYEFNEDLTADEIQLQKDIENYGIHEYSINAPYSKEDYDMLNMKYIKIIIGKGLATLNDLCGARDLYLEVK